MKLKVIDVVVLGMLGAVMYASKAIMAMLPNIHLLGVIIVATTVVYRKKAIFPIYIYASLLGLFEGFTVWWIPNLYTWTVLWGAVMLLPKKMPNKIAVIVYMIVCGLHGFLYGVLCAPSQALFFGLNFNSTIAWIISGIGFDITHGISNTLCGLLIVPLISVLKRADRYASRT